MIQETHDSIVPVPTDANQGRETKADPIEAAKERIAQDAGEFVRYIDAIVSQHLGIDIAEGVVAQVLQARQLNSTKAVDDALLPHLEVYAQGKIRLNPITIDMDGATLSFRITDLGYVEISLSPPGKSAALTLNINAEALGNGDAPYSHMDLRLFNYTDTPNRFGGGGNYFNRMTLDVLADGYAKDETGAAVPVTLPVRVNGQNGAYEYTVNYKFIPGMEGQGFSVDPSSLRIQGKEVALSGSLTAGGTPNLLTSGEATTEAPQNQLLTQQIDVNGQRLQLEIKPVEGGISISVPQRPEIPTFTIPAQMDLLTFLKGRFSGLLGSGE